MSNQAEQFVETVLEGMDGSKQLEEMVKGQLKDAFESLMGAERTGFLETQREAGEANKGNGTYGRGWESRYGPIEDLRVPRDRRSRFQTRLFEPHQRRDGWLEELVIRLYSQGVSTREVARLLEQLYGRSYSASTVSRITEIATEEIEAWKNRPLERRYSVLYLDATVVKLRRDTVENEAVYLACGVNEGGYREVLGYFVGGSESAHVWRELLEELKHRGVEDVLLVVADGLTGLKDEVKQTFPKADVQPCVVHRVRNTLNKVRHRDRAGVAEDLRKIYKAPDREVAKKYLKTFRNEWKSTYPSLVERWEQELDELLTFMDYPEAIWSVIYTTNWIERVCKEVKKRLKPMGHLPSEDAAEKILYLKLSDLNERWSERKLRGFGRAHEELQTMFQERYPRAQTQSS